MKLKKYFLIIIFLFVVNAAAQAQIEKGSKLIGGSGFELFQDPYYARLMPNMGYFITNRLAIGSSLYVNVYGYNNYIERGVGLSPFARYYFGKGHNRLFALGSLGYRYSWHESTEVNNAFKSSNGRPIGELGIGFTHLLTDQVGLEAILIFSRINFGLQIYLPSSGKR